MVLLVVDTQKGITNERLFEFEKVKNNIKKLIDTARENGVEVIFVQHDDGPGSGFSVGDEDFEIYDEFKPKDNELIFYKKVNSAFNKATGLLSYLEEKNIRQVIIVGLQTNFCIDATIKSGFEHGLEMIVPHYTNSTTDNEYMTKEACYHYYNDFMWPKRYAKCISMNDAIAMLLE